jgi:hypothetical protein
VDSPTAARQRSGGLGTAPRLSGALGIAVTDETDRLNWEVVQSALAAAGDLGLEARLVRPGEDQARLGVLLGIGYQRGFAPVFRVRQCCPRILWVGEPLRPAGESGRGALATLAQSRAMEVLRFPLRPLRHCPLPRPLARMRARAVVERERARNTRDLQELAGRVDCVVVTSGDRQAMLAGNAVSSEVVPYGYEPAVAGPLASPGDGPRDLPIVSLATLDPRIAWRRAIVERQFADEPGLTVATDVWGPERNALLRRARVVLNVQRVPGDFLGIRMILALAAGAVLVTEPMTDPRPFVPGVHYVEAPLERLLAEARALLADEPRRRRIAEAGQALLVEELTMTRSLVRVLSYVRA